MTQSRNIDYENLRIGKEVHGFSLSKKDFAEINAKIDGLYPVWLDWMKERERALAGVPTTNFTRADFMRFVVARGLVFTESQIKEKSNVAA